jgi:hypothetical protein
VQSKSPQIDGFLDKINRANIKRKSTVASDSVQEELVLGGSFDMLIIKIICFINGR